MANLAAALVREDDDVEFNCFGWFVETNAFSQSDFPSHQVHEVYIEPQVLLHRWKLLTTRRLSRGFRLQLTVKREVIEAILNSNMSCYEHVLND